MIKPPARRHTLRTVLWTLSAVVVTVMLAGSVTVTTRQGVNFDVTEHRLPLYLKTFEFMDRDAQYRQIANEITRGAASDESRMTAVLAWTSRRIQPTPEHWAVVDDHILNIIIRGHGTSDQRADVFATLLTYAGVPAFWQRIDAPNTHDGVILTFVHVDGRWVVVDVANGFVFRNDRGQLAAAGEFASGRVVMPPEAGHIAVGATPYAQILAQVRMPVVPRTLRAELQMPWPRIWHSARTAVGLESDHGTRE